MQRILVTGASRGLGRALVVELTGRGWQVIATARRVADLADLPAVGRLTLDVTSDASVAAAAAAAGPVDVLVNNAAVSVAASIEDTSPDVALRMLDANAVGPLRLIRAFLPGMRERGSGTVANVSSVAGKAAFPMNGLHAASKHALEALSEALSVEVSPFGIRVLVLQLGSIATEMYESQPRYVGLPYAELDRVQQAGFVAHRDRRATAEQAAVMIADAIDGTDSPLRVPVGQDAAWLLAERARLDDAAWSARMREIFGLEKRLDPA